MNQNSSLAPATIIPDSVPIISDSVTVPVTTTVTPINSELTQEQMDNNVPDESMNTNNTTGCPLVEKNKVYPDGIPYAPVEVLTQTAFIVFKCAVSQALQKLWTPPTPEQKQNMTAMLSAFYQNYKTNTTKHSADIMSCADKLNLQVCRVQKPDNSDSYLLFMTKYGAKNYNGPFLLLREHNASNVVIVSPHDGSDYTHYDTKLAFAESKAFACVSNGHGKWSRQVDFCHTQNTLGYYCMVELCKLMSADKREPVITHIHGMADPTCVLRHCRKNNQHQDVMTPVFDKTITDNSTVKTFKGLGVSFALQNIITQYYVQTEIPVRQHKNNPTLVTKIVQAFEQQPWSWTK